MISKSSYFSPFRTYRASSSHKDEMSFQVMLEETDLWITCLAEGNADLPERILEEVAALRSELKIWIAAHPEFMASYSPVKTGPEASPLVRHMAAGARLLGVGPMACVAGAIAQSVAMRFKGRSSEFLVENGGDIYIYSTRPRRIALLTDPRNGGLLGLELRAKLFPLSICSSSATIGHSLSFGQGELATVLAKDGALADAAATAFCNMLKGPQDIEHVLGKAQSLKSCGLHGVFLQCGERLGLWGDMELTAL